MTASVFLRATRRSIATLALATFMLSPFVTAADAQPKPRPHSGNSVDSPPSGDAIRVIISGSPEQIRRVARRYGLTVKRQLSLGGALEVTRAQLDALNRDDDVPHVSSDAIVQSTMAVATTAIGADQVWDGLDARGSVTGLGVGIAILDSGIGYHPDLAGRVVVNVDFVNPDGGGEDAYGHGTHVAGIAAARSDSDSGIVGVAPGAHLINLRVLNDEGWGHASTVIEAIDWAIENKDQYAIRVVNLSLGAGVTESYRDDPLGQAVERAVSAGLVVVCSAGNYGKTEEGIPVIGGITSPGNTPSALTVGAINTFGTAVRSDDEVTTYSSRGPTAFDYVLKPDLVAPGNKVVSLQAPTSYLATHYPERLVAGGYLQLSGTSMSAAVVSGAVALLLESSPNLTPQQVKVALQATASPVVGAGLVEAGAGSLNVISAVQTGLLGPTADLPLASIEGENVAMGGLVFADQLAGEDGNHARSEGQALVWGN